MNPKPKLDESKLTPDQRDKLDKWKNDVKQLQTLEDIATMAQEMLGIMDDQNKAPGRKTLIIDHVTGDDFVKILQNMQDSLQAFKEQKEPVLPDYSKPIVEAVSKLEQAVSAAMKATAPKPVVNVSAPNVNVSPTPIDFTKVERILKTDVPKAFQKAIDSIPAVDIPEFDNSPVVDKLTEVIDWLQSIDTASRMKPKPGSIKVTNPDGTPITSTLVADTTKFGVIQASGDTVVMSVISGMAGWTMGYYGTYATGASLTMEVSFDNQTSYASVRMLQGSSGVLGYVVTIAAVSNSTSYFTADIPTGATHLRVRCSAWAAPTGVMNVKIGQSPNRFASPAIGGQAVSVTGSVSGLKTNNAAVPAATNLGVLSNVANAAAPTFTETFQTTLSSDLKGNTRTRLQDAAGNDRGVNVNAANQLTVITEQTPAATVLNTYAVRITTNTTTTPTSSTAYISSITMTTEVAGTTSTVTIRDKQGTPQVLVNGLTTTAASLTPTVLNFQTPVKMTSGIDIITAGAVAGTVDVWVNYYA